MQQNQSGQLPEGLPEDQSTGHTLREIADAIGVDKSTVFRYVQRCGIAPIDATQRCKRYSATAENAIVEHFATMRNDSTTMRGRLAMMRNSSGNDAGNDAQSVQRCSATTPDSSGELDAIRAELDRVTAERDQLRHSSPTKHSSYRRHRSRGQALPCRLNPPTIRPRTHARACGRGYSARNEESPTRRKFGDLTGEGSTNHRKGLQLYYTMFPEGLQAGKER